MERLLAHHRGRNQRSSSGHCRRVARNHGEHSFAPQTGVGLARSKPGVSESVDDLACGYAVTVGDRELERLTDVGVLFADPDGRLALGDVEIPERLAGEAPDPFEVTSGQRVSFPCLIEALGGV